ncbi:M14 family metallopeptidase [Geosporobacter ferrireducens]|uniref:Succinylglutamate desuccinylase n=1 Tax=Geosporobacter ferrireducens TaxID=1424294 RepID=A0A1D8GNI0_9FIRM|nr:M14 family metallopeptidase [Geosporobacter ferrireducens]AOT72479.1 succinylglutamate desuccinylase [Geosporobacter ferrireducens]MTI58225.1 succinylglutamate desuccinylase [Geosporobacter ferrireducens]
MKPVLSICGISAERGDKAQGFVTVLGTKTMMPVTLINGEKQGKIMLITAGIHGSEYPGILTAIRLAGELDPKYISGQIILIHPVNLQAFSARCAAVVPEDGKNINRVFPGSKNGSIAEKIAYLINNSFFEIADYYMDLHGGDLHESLTPYAYFSGNCHPEVVRASRDMGAVLDLPYMVNCMETVGAFGCAAMRGIPSILVERGGNGLCLEADVKKYILDVKRVLRKLNILSDDHLVYADQAPIELTNVCYIEAKQKGCWLPVVTAGQKIRKGDKLGDMTDFFGQVLDTYFAEFDGVVLYQCASLSAPQGTELVAYGELAW